MSLREIPGNGMKKQSHGYRMKMEKTKTSKIPGFDQRVSYRIKIQGELDQSWAERFYGMSIEVQNGEENVYISTLTGSLPDQAALSGLLNTLYDMHFTILSVEMVKENDNGVLE